MEIKVSNTLFGGSDETIGILGSDCERKVRQFGPMGIGTAPTSIRGSAKSPAKYSAVAKVLDYIFVDCVINALCSNDAVYGEFSTPDNKYRFLVTDEGKSVSFFGKRPHNNYKAVPLFLYAIRNNAEIPEMVDAFLKVKEEYDTDGAAHQVSVLECCDIFYYGIGRKTQAVEFNEDDLQMETVQASVRSGLLKPFAVFNDLELPKFEGISIEEAEHANAKNNGEIFSGIKGGEYSVAYDWNENQKVRIPSPQSLEGFIPSPTYFALVSKIKTRMDNVLSRLNKGMQGIEAIGKDYVNLFVTGKPGTGKTTLAYALGAATGMPVYTVAMTKNTEEDVFQGMNKVVDGSLKFVSTDFLDAYTNGGIIILEEINLPDPSVVMGALGQAVEFPFILMKDGYVPVKRHPMCVIIGTMNIGTFGSKGVNQALSSRFRQSYILNDPTKEDFIKILLSNGAEKKAANWVYGAYEKINDYLRSPSVNQEDVCLNVTLRGCIGALENMSEGENPKQAIRNTLVGKISEIDLELAEDVYKNVIESLPDFIM